MKFYLVVRENYVNDVVYSTPSRIKGWFIGQTVVEYDTDLSIPPKVLRPIEIRKDHKKLKADLVAWKARIEADIKNITKDDRPAVLERYFRDLAMVDDFLTDFE